MNDGGSPVVRVENPEGSGPLVLLCDHASNRIPDAYERLGLSEDALQSHIAWDPGALRLSQLLSKRLHAPLLWPDVSRLVIDCNRPPSEKSLIVVESEGGSVPGNRGLSPKERQRRLETVHAPYHAAIDLCLASRRHAPTALIAVHSFTAVYLGKRRPWQIGIVADEDRRLSSLLLSKLRSDAQLTVGLNEPYSPADQVYYTISRHAGPRGLPATMIEIRNDEIAGEAGRQRWADCLAGILLAAIPILFDRRVSCGAKIAFPNRRELEGIEQ